LQNRQTLQASLESLASDLSIVGNRKEVIEDITPSAFIVTRDWNSVGLPLVRTVNCPKYRVQSYLAQPFCRTRIGTLGPAR